MGIAYRKFGTGLFLADTKLFVSNWGLDVFKKLVMIQLSAVNYDDLIRERTYEK